ncbi:flagellar motor switch protein [Enterococcus faecium]|nr:flagellar motor switch protein [Enterococcus faecium]
METEWQRRERKNRKKEEMLRLCRLLDVKDWDKNEQIAQKVRSIIHKEEKVKNKDTRRTENEKRKVQKKREKSKS